MDRFLFRGSGIHFYKQLAESANKHMSEEANQSDTKNFQTENGHVGFLSWVNHAPPLQFVFLGVTVIFSASMFILIGVVLSTLIFGVSFLSPDILGQIDEPNVMSALKLMQILQHIGIFIIPALIFAYLVNKQPVDYLRLNQSALPITYFLAAMIMLLSMPIINWMIIVNEAMALPDFLAGLERWMQQAEASAAEVTEKFLYMDSTGDLLLNLLMIAIIPAVGEELLFRGVLQRILISWTKNIHVGILIAAILFSAMHMQFYGFFPRMMLGVLFGYLFVWSGSLLLPIFCHLINNAAAVIFVYVEGVEAVGIEENNFGSSADGSLFTVASALAIAALLYVIHKREKLTENST